MKPALLASLVLPLLLMACGATPPVATVAISAATPDPEPLLLTLTPSQHLTLDAGHTGQAGYYCRYAVCAGDDPDNHEVRGLLEFTLPATLQQTEILSATLTLKPANPRSTQGALEALGRLHLEHVAALEFDAPVLGLLAQTAGPDGLTLDVAEALRADLKRGVSQYRLRLEQPTNHDGRAQLYRLELSEPGNPEPSPLAPTLVIRFRVP